MCVSVSISKTMSYIYLYFSPFIWDTMVYTGYNFILDTKFYHKFCIKKDTS